jgi:hypothetical protein
MAEAAHDTASGERLFEAYAGHVEQLKPQHRNRTLRDLAKANAVHVLCREMLGEVLPWSEQSAKRFQSWYDTVLRSNAHLLDSLRQHVAGLLKEPNPPDGVLSLVRRVLPKKGEPGASSGLSALYNALARALPLEPLSDQWGEALTPLPDGLSPREEGRLRVLSFMRDVKQRAGEPSWSTADFPYTDSVWQNDVQALSPGEAASVLEWGIRTSALNGVTAPKDAADLVRILGAVKEKTPQNIADAVVHLLQGRDPVTDVLVATAFARCALEGSKPSAAWGRVLGAILERFDKRTLDLFERHLQHRFCRRDSEYETRLEQLRIDAGLARPKSTTSPERPAETSPSLRLARDQQPSVATSFVSSVTRHLRRLVKRPDASTEMSDPQEKRED